MRVVRDLSRALPPAPSAVAVGVFDGVHLGHRAIISGMVDAARAQDRTAVAYTFDPHPASAMGHLTPPLLSTLDERAEIMGALGVDILVVPPFTPETARTRAAEFVDLLIQRVRLVDLWAGADFALGYQREGDIPFMTSLGRERGFEVHVVEPVQCRGDWVSSSRIRSALGHGDLDSANACLGRPYRLGGHISASPERHHSDRTLAAQLTPDRERLIPGRGAYLCRARSSALRNWPCIVNVIAQRNTADEQSIVDVYALRTRDGLQAGRLDLDFIAPLEADELGIPVDLERGLRPEDAKRARALFSRLS